MSDIIELMERRFRALGLQVAVGDRFIEVDGVGTGGDLLRGELQLNGAKAGWCLGQCGACAVIPFAFVTLALAVLYRCALAG